MKPRSADGETNERRRKRFPRRAAGRGIGRVVLWNALFALFGLAILVVIGEARLRRSVPFAASRYPLRFVPEVGVLLEPEREVRWTNMRDYWTISRTNRLGFLDRESPPPQRATGSCRVAFIGDSFVDAPEVEVGQKFQVGLEALAARERPDLGLTTSAFGIKGTGTIQWIPLYDVFVRSMQPRVLVLVAAPNDYGANADTLWEVSVGRWRAELYARVVRGPDGGLRVRSPEESSSAVREWARVHDRRSTGFDAWLRAQSYLWGRLEHAGVVAAYQFHERVWASRKRWRRLAGETPVLRGRRPPASALLPEQVSQGIIAARRVGSRLPPAFEEAVEMTAFALDEFQRRAARDGAHLVLFQHYLFGRDGDFVMRNLAEERGIPVVDQYEYMRDIGGDPRAARFAGDSHWTPTGHRWAAEALWEYLKEHPFLCDPAETGAREG